MSSVACRSLPITLLALLCCSGSGKKAFEVNLWSEKQAVEATESFKVNCSTSCENPEKGGLETSMSKIMLEHHPQGKWKEFLVSNISNDTTILCYFSCENQQHSKHLNIKVYQPPTQVTLRLHPPRVVVGEAFTVECSASAVKPLESLTLILLRGRETLQNQTFEGTEHEATAIFNSTALTKDGLNLTCQAELDLRPHGGDIISRISESQILEVFGVAGRGVSALPDSLECRPPSLYVTLEGDTYATALCYQADCGMQPMQDNQMVIIITVVSILLFLFVTSVLLCFILGQHWHRNRMGTYGVLAAWRRLPRASRQRPV